MPTFYEKTSDTTFKEVVVEPVETHLSLSLLNVQLEILNIQKSSIEAEIVKVQALIDEAIRLGVVEQTDPVKPTDPTNPVDPVNPVSP